MSIIKKYPKSTAFAALAVLLAVHAVLGWAWSENADTPFWWKFWEWSAGISAFLFIGLILWAVTKRKKFDE